MTKYAILLGGCLLTSVGCSATTSPTTVKVTPATSSLKGVIDGIAQSGQIGSAGMELSAKYEELKKTDSAKADAIKADYDKLMKAEGKPDQVKQIATELSKKL